MKLYYAPMACSLVPHITLIEVGAEFEHERVDLRSKKTASGADFSALNPKGYVPALEVAPGELLTEVAAIVQYIAEAHPEAGLMPEGALERARVREWLNFTATELHKNFSGLFNPMASEDSKAMAVKMILHRLKVVEAHLQGREYLGESMSVADIYLAVVISWGQHLKLDLSSYPSAAAFMGRMLARPSVAQAMANEGIGR